MGRNGPQPIRFSVRPINWSLRIPHDTNGAIAIDKPVVGLSRNPRQRCRSLPKTSSGVKECDSVLMGAAMFGFLSKLLLAARSRLKSRGRLEAENIVLRQQVIVLSRKSQARLRLLHGKLS